jgi:hypothetical protein
MIDSTLRDVLDTCLETDLFVKYVANAAVTRRDEGIRHAVFAREAGNVFFRAVRDWNRYQSDLAPIENGPRHSAAIITAAYIISHTCSEYSDGAKPEQIVGYIHEALSWRVTWVLRKGRATNRTNC